MWDFFIKEFNYTAFHGILIDEIIAYFFISVLREATTNAIRHAESTRVTAIVRELENSYTFEITNNGNPPFREGLYCGGLSGIRDRLNNIGGALTIHWMPKFKMNINVQKTKVVQGDT